MQTRKHRLVPGLASLLVVALSLEVTPAYAQSGNLLETIKQRGKILIATDINLPPFGYLNAQAQQAGSDVDTARLLAQDLKVELEIIPVTGQNRIPYLLSRKADVVMSSFSITDARKKVIDFTDPVGVAPQVLAGPSTTPVSDWPDLADQSIAVTRGTAQDQELARSIREHNIPNIKVVRYEDDASTNTAIITGQQHLLATAPTIVTMLKKAHPTLDLEVKFSIKENPYAIGLRKNEPELLAWLNDWIKTNIQNGKLNEIYARHHGYPLPPAYRP